jgi:hypothetical protein
MKKEPQQLKEFEVIGKAIPKFTVNPLDYIKATSQEKKDIDSNEDMLQKIKQATVQFQMTELVKTLLQEQIKNSLYTQPMQPSMYPNGGNVDGYMLPEVEIKAKRINTKYKPAIDKNGGTTPSEPTSNANLIPFIQWLALLAADTATDQIPGNIVTNAKAGFDMYKGHPITSALNYAKIPATPPFDALINILQNNPSGYDTEHLDDYIKKQFRKKASPNKVSNNYAQGGEVIEERDDITDEELKELLAQGYDVEIDGKLHKGSVQKFPGGGKVYDEKTNQMLIVDKDNLQIFNIKGEQLDWDDFKDRKWAARGNQKALADKKNQEIENQGITSEYAKRRTSDSEAILNILHNRAGGQYDNYLDNVDATTDSIKHLIKEQNETSYAESPLSWQFGVPIEGFVKRTNDYKVSEYTPSQPMKMFSYNPDYYFSPLGKGYEGDIINALLYGDKLDSEDYSHLSAPYYDEAKNSFNKQTGSLLEIMNSAYKSKDKKSQQQTTIGHMGGMTAFYNKDENGKPYVSLVDDWNLDPQVTMGSMVKAVPDFILKGKLKEIGVPEDKHDDFIQKYKAGKPISEILGYGHGLPIYDRVYFDESKVKEGTITRESIQHPYVVDNLKKIKTLDSLQSNKIYPFSEPKSYKHGGEVINEYEVGSITPEEIAKLQAEGYDIEIDGVMHYAKGGGVNDPQKFVGGGKANPFELVETPEGNIPFYLLSTEEQDKLYNNSTEDARVYIAPMLPPVTITGKKPAPQATISEYKPKSIGRKVWESLVAPVSAMDRFTDTTYDNPNALDNALSIINPFSWIDGSINLAKSSKDIVTGNGNIGDVIDVGLTASLAAAGIRGKKLKGVGKTTKAILNDMFNPLAGLVGTTPIPYGAKTIEQAEKAMSEYNRAAGTAFDEDQLKDYMVDYNNNNNDYLFEPFTNIGIPITSSSQLDGTLPGGDNEQIQLYNRLAAMFEVMPSADKRKLFPNLPTGGQRLMREIERIAEMDVKEAGKKVYATVTEPITDIITGNKQSFKGVKSKTARSLYGSNYVTKYDLLKDPKISKAEKAKIKKMSPEELENSYLSPKMKLVPDELGTQQADVKPMMRNEYVDRFNSNLDRLNEIIAANNTSGRDYRVTGLDEFGNLKFADADGTSSFGTDITPGEFADELQEVADFVYYRNVPGLSMANTVNSVFSDKKKRRGSKAYESINTYLKEMNLGRVKAGFNSQTISSLGLWSDYVKKNKAVGYHPSKDLVYAVMRGLLPATVLTNEFYKAQNQDGKDKNN